jgi:hypothetical protein
MRVIRVLQPFISDATGNEYIAKGDYLEDAPALHGLADELLTRGVAIALKQTKVVTPEALEKSTGYPNVPRNRRFGETPTDVSAEPPAAPEE